MSIDAGDYHGRSNDVYPYDGSSATTVYYSCSSTFDLSPSLPPAWYSLSEGSLGSYSRFAPPHAPPAKSAVGAMSSTPSLLTQELMDIGEETLLCYDVVHTKHFSSQPEHPPPNPFFYFSPEELERYYVAAIDAKNAIRLRKSVVKADIGDALELLLPKLSLYERDGAILETLLNELLLIRGTCSDRHISLNFHGLEFRRYILPQYGRSVLEKHGVLFSALRHTLGQKDDAQQVAQKFMDDPTALLEHRLPLFGTSQR